MSDGAVRRAVLEAPEAPDTERRQALLEAARRAFAEHGYSATRVDDISRRAGVSHGTFYLYFNNKQEALDTLARRLADEMYALAEDLTGIGPGEDGYERLRDWIRRFVEIYEPNIPVIQAWSAADVSEPRFQELGRQVLGHFTDLIHDHIVGAIAQGHRHPVDPRSAALALVAMLERSCYWGLAMGGWPDRDAGIDTLASLVHQAIWGGASARRRGRIAWRR